jgi:hypothetical protein
LAGPRFAGSSIFSPTVAFPQGRQRRELFRAPAEEGSVADQDRTNRLLRKTCEGPFKIAIGTGIGNNELQAQRAGRLSRIRYECLRLPGRRVSRAAAFIAAVDAGELSPLVRAPEHPNDLRAKEAVMDETRGIFTVAPRPFGNEPFRVEIADQAVRTYGRSAAAVSS